MRKVTNTETFIEKARIKHGDKYDYSKTVYAGSMKKVIITCKKHGDFIQTASDHLAGCGCQECWKERKATPRISKDKILELFQKVHGDKYDYSKVDYTGIENHVCIICPEHGEFMQAPHNHIKGQGCPKCANKKKGMFRVGTTESFIEKSKQVHGDKYDYSKVNYVNNRVKVCIICPEHGEFYQKPLDHTLGRGCAECGKNLD